MKLDQRGHKKEDSHVQNGCWALGGAASGAAQGLQDRKGQKQRQGAAQRSGHGSIVLAPRPEANRRAAALCQPAGAGWQRVSRSWAVIPDMLLPQDFKPGQQPATPHSLRPAPATGGVRRLIGRGTRCCVLIGYTVSGPLPRLQRPPFCRYRQ